jgi:hypothetical protein
LLRWIVVARLLLELASALRVIEGGDVAIPGVMMRAAEFNAPLPV